MTADLADIDARWLHGQTGEWKELAPRAAFASRAQVLGLCVALSQPVAGHIVEFGVWQGASTRAIRDALRRTRRWDRAQRAKRIYACDSFEGLPESYEHLSAGTFATPVPRLRGVRIVKGYFEDSLTPELAREVSRVSLAHLDADLYSSTRCALDWMTPLLHTGSLLMFDEFADEDAAERRAFLDWSAEHGVQTALIALFARGPSGNGEITDRRALFQVIGNDDLARRRSTLPRRAHRRLRSLR